MQSSGHAFRSRATRLLSVLALCVTATLLSGCIGHEGGSGYYGGGYGGGGYYGGGYQGGRTAHYTHSGHGRSYGRGHHGGHHAQSTHHAQPTHHAQSTHHRRELRRSHRD